MSKGDKLRAMEAIWTDLTQDEVQFESPTWHEGALKESEQLLKDGKTQFSDWDEAKKRLRQRAQRIT